MCEVMENLVCEVMEDVVKDREAQAEARGKAQGVIEGKAQEREALAVRALSMKKLSLEEIAEMFKLSIGRVTELGRLHSLL